jgi:pyruvate formate lyase activating enzyme
MQLSLPLLPQLADCGVPDGVDDVPLDEVKAYLKESASWLDGVVITGGEPTQDPELLTLAAYIKSLGLQVKLDTNGSEPDVLEELIGRHLVDYIAMDVKNSFGEYAETVGTLPDLDDVKKSIEIVMDFAAHEFRTTVVPDLVEEEDIVKILWLSARRTTVYPAAVPS